jgi:hypothetical protein
MNSTNIAEQNRIAWTNRAKGALERYSAIFNEGASWRQDPFARDIPQRFAYYLRNDAVSLLVTEHAREADMLFSIAEEVTSETLQNEKFDQGSPFIVVYDIETARIRGKAICLETNHNAHWYRTGKKNPSQLQEAVTWYAQFYDLTYKKYGGSVEEVMLRYIAAEDYSGAVSWYQIRYRKALSPSINDKRYTRNSTHALYYLAEYARGNKDVMSTARAGIKYWYDLFTDSRYKHPDHLFEEKMIWFYFWHHYFCDKSDGDIRKMLVESRGY